MKILLIIVFILCLIPVNTDAVTTVTGYRGESVQIRCNYTAGYEENRKYLCRGDCSTAPWGRKNILVQSESDPEDKRFSLRDKKRKKNFVITITDLKPEDEGTYWCGVQHEWLDDYTEINLVVKTASAVTGFRGGSVQIRCDYEAKYKSHRKYLCRGDCSTLEREDILVQSGFDPEDKRFSLYDNTAEKVFIVNITDVKPKDAGTYWCGIKRVPRDEYTKINLLVKADNPVRRTLSLSTRFPSIHTVTPSKSTPLTTDSTIIIVIVALLLIGLVLLIVVLKKRRRKKHGVSPPCVSERIEDTGRCSEAVYSNLEDPTCDSSPYENVSALAQLEAAPCDSARAAADMPSNSPDEDFYSTAQLPADPSASSVGNAQQSFEKPDEGPIYAQVKFNVAHSTVFKKGDDSCEYSTVTEVLALSPE